MSLKLKFSTNSSTPAKIKSPKYSMSASPVKSSKYKHFLTSVLTPRTRKWMQRKKSAPSEDSSTLPQRGDEDPQELDDFNEPGYSSIQDLHSSKVDLKPPFPRAGQSSGGHPLNPEETDSLDIVGEPLYASVDKQKKKESGHSGALQRSEQESGEESNLLLHRHPHTQAIRSKKEELLNTVQEQKEEIGLLVGRLKEVTQENRELHKNIETILREHKWKEDSLHAELKLKISELEADTHKEVNCLSEQIRTLLKERKVLTDQVDMMHEEKKLLQVEFEAACVQAKTRVSPEFLKKTVEDHQKLVSVLKKRHLEEIKDLQQEYETESITVERDILLSKVSHQDEQQHLMKVGVVEYSVNLGRLQEHISNLSKEKLDELQKLKNSESARDESIRSVYGRQLDLLRSQVISQSNTIHSLETEKSKLETQLEGLWQAACFGKSKLLEDMKYSA